MKTKKLLVLMVMFLFLITAVVVAPNVAYAEGESGTIISDEFKQILNGEEKLVVTDTTMSENKQDFLYSYVLKYITNEYNFRLVLYDEANSKCDISMTKIADSSQETHTVDVVYNYDKTVRAKLSNFVKNFPKTNNSEYYFYIRDLELVNYLINNVQSEDTENLDAFSGELKSLVDNNNIDYYVDNRAGAEDLFIRERIGIATFKYDGIIYYLDPALGTKAEYIMYVPDATTNSKEDIMTVAQKRINEYLNNDNIAKLSYAETVDDVWCNIMYEATRYEWEPQAPNMTLEEWKGAFYPAYDEYGKEVVGIEGIEKTDFVYNLTVKVGDKQKVFQIIIKKDSSKMVTPTYKTADLLTNVAVSSEAGIIPLDASLKANQITSGDEYQKIIKLLDVQENAMYDLKLYSGSLKNYVTKLDDGTFEVKIPVPDNLKGKELVAYYTTGTGEPEKYAVEVKDGYAIFKTNHFSIYTLAESNVTPSGNDEENKGNTGKTDGTGNNGEETGDSDNGTENTNGENKNTENSNNENKDAKNPKTQVIV